ncbi:hypothetical protein EON65_59215 [archaeon]|nr:MAG: hypothetical protein EON65_59215 [archaeon]
MQTQESLQQRLSTLDVDYFRQRDKLTSALEEQKKIGEQISIANAIIRNEKEKIANMKKKKMAETNKKHNGVYVCNICSQFTFLCI